MQLTLEQVLFLLDQSVGVYAYGRPAKATSIEDFGTGDDGFLRVEWEEEGIFGALTSTFNRADNETVELVQDTLLLVDPDGEVCDLKLLKFMNNLEALVKAGELLKQSKL